MIIYPFVKTLIKTCRMTPEWFSGQNEGCPLSCRRLIPEVREWPVTIPLISCSHSFYALLFPYHFAILFLISRLYTLRPPFVHKKWHSCCIFITRLIYTRLITQFY